MTLPDAMKLLTQNVNEFGQAEVARRLGISAAAISQLLSGKYQANPDNILKRVVEIFGGIAVECPVLGEIPLSQCSSERKKPFAATSHQRVALYRACQACPQNGGKS
jgi:transcriptional regulator with XRE-family HTH domain